MKLDKKILVNDTNPIISVDDDQIVLKIITRYYAKSDLPNPLLTFSNGNEFIEHIKDLKEGEPGFPSLVLLDINMPGLSGFDVLKKLRSQPEFKNVPVCSMLTSSEHNNDVKLATELGADEFLVKPANPREYVEFFNQIAENAL